LNGGFAEMKHAETVTFGGSGFDRAGELRGNDAKLAEFLTLAATRVLPVWRAKPLIGGSASDRLQFLAPDHPVFKDASEAPVFLGMDQGIAHFARDISAWTAPAADTAKIGAFVDDSEQVHPDLPPDQRFAELRRIMTRLSARDVREFHPVPHGRIVLPRRGRMHPLPRHLGDIFPVRILHPVSAARLRDHPRDTNTLRSAPRAARFEEVIVSQVFDGQHLLIHVSQCSTKNRHWKPFIIT